jgi:hypothetical protein
MPLIWNLPSLSLGWLLQQQQPQSKEGNLNGAGFAQPRSASDGLITATRGSPFQLMLMDENNRCSTWFRLLVPGG